MVTRRGKPMAGIVPEPAVWVERSSRYLLRGSVVSISAHFDEPLGKLSTSWAPVSLACFPGSGPEPKSLFSSTRRRTRSTSVDFPEPETPVTRKRCHLAE
ncbi:MAG: hypothetical protein HY720_28995 [Planctomycetes bacterium]|nr:hypothetical protein [Planctomycetota bacterium]